MDVWGIVWLFVLLLVNAFFVGAEFAVISARRSQIEPRAEAGSRAAKTALWAMSTRRSCSPRASSASPWRPC